MEDGKDKVLNVQINQESLAFLWAGLELTDQFWLPNSQSYESDDISVVVRYGNGGIVRLGDYVFSHNSNDLHKCLKEEVTAKLHECPSETRRKALSIASTLLDHDRDFYTGGGIISRSFECRDYILSYRKAVRNFGFFEDSLKTREECEELIEGWIKEARVAISGLL